jgi:protein-tyrosine-phosphatase
MIVSSHRWLGFRFVSDSDWYAYSDNTQNQPVAYEPMMTSRRFVVTIALLNPALIWAQNNPPAAPKPKVVFVCEHGAAMSVIAATEFSRMAKQNGLDVTVLTRGTNPDAEIPSVVRNGLKADGHDIGSMKPTKLSDADLKNATKIVSFGPDLTPWLPPGATVADWSATPSVSQNYAAARDYIRRQLETLLKDLKK